MTKKHLPNEEQETLNAQLRDAVMTNNDAETEQLLVKGADVNHMGFELHDENNDKYSALHKACQLANFEVAKTLLEYGADVDIQSSIYKHTPLHIAMSYWDSTAAFERENLPGKQLMVDLLIAANAKLHLKDSQNKTPADSAPFTNVSNYFNSIKNGSEKRPTPESVGLDMVKRNIALGITIEATNTLPDVPATSPLITMSPEEIIRRQQQQAIENDEGI